jgi:chromate transporter
MAAAAMTANAFELGWRLMLLSLIAISGVDTIVPDIYRFVVENRGWLSERQFTDLYAIARAAPGPNSLLVTLIGWQVAGFLGAVIATLALCGLPFILAFYVSRIWHRFEGVRWRTVLQKGLAPITSGLVLGSGYILASAADQSWAAAAITAGSVLAILFGGVHPLFVLALGAIAGVVGLV